MRQFLSKQKNSIAFLLWIALWFAAVYAWGSWINAIPLDQPISLTPKGTIQTTLRIITHESYQLEFAFEPQGGAPAPPDDKTPIRWSLPLDVKVPVRWSIQNEATSLIASGEIDSSGWAWYSGDIVGRAIATINLEPGTYFLYAEILRDVPEFAQVKTRIRLVPRSKDSPAWQKIVEFWGTVIFVFLLMPAGIIVSIKVLWSGLAQWFPLRFPRIPALERFGTWFDDNIVDITIGLLALLMGGLVALIGIAMIALGIAIIILGIYGQPLHQNASLTIVVVEIIGIGLTFVGYCCYRQSIQTLRDEYSSQVRRSM